MTDVEDKKRRAGYKEKYVATHKNEIREYERVYREKNREKLRLYQSEYRKAHKYKYDHAQQRRELWIKNPGFKIAHNLRIRMRQVLKGSVKGGGLKELIGCDFDFLKRHIESQFKDGMSWFNYKQFGWHVDHIKPCASFDLTNIEEQKKCFHYTNLQPLWWFDNISKGKKQDKNTKQE